MSRKSFPICYEDCVSEPSLREFGIRRYKKPRMFECFLLYLSSHEFKLLPSLVELLRLDSLWIMFADWSWGWHGCWSLDLDWQLSLQSPLHFTCIILSLSFTHYSNTFHVTSHLKSIWIIYCLWSCSVPVQSPLIIVLLSHKIDIGFNKIREYFTFLVSLCALIWVNLISRQQTNNCVGIIKYLD